MKTIIVQGRLFGVRCPNKEELEVAASLLTASLGGNGGRARVFQQSKGFNFGGAPVPYTFEMVSDATGDFLCMRTIAVKRDYAFGIAQRTDLMGMICPDGSYAERRNREQFSFFPVLVMLDNNGEEVTDPDVTMGPDILNLRCSIYIGGKLKKIRQAETGAFMWMRGSPKFEKADGCIDIRECPAGKEENYGLRFISVKPGKLMAYQPAVVRAPFRAIFRDYGDETLVDQLPKNY